jgi:hypothetical protein
LARSARLLAFLRPKTEASFGRKKQIPQRCQGACKKGAGGASSDNGNGGYLRHLLFGISLFFGEALAAKSVVTLAWGFRRPQSVGTRPDRSTIPNHVLCSNVRAATNAIATPAHRDNASTMKSLKRACRSGANN